MDPDPASLLVAGSPEQLAYIFLLTFINGAFVAAEYALISCDPDAIVEEDKSASKSGYGRLSSRWLIEHMGLAVASIQLGITICSILIGWLAIDFFRMYFAVLEAPYLFDNVNLQFLVPLLSAIVLVTLVHVVLGELVVKAISTSFPETTLAVLAGPIRLFCLLSYPVSKMAFIIANLFLRPFSLSIGQSDQATLSIAEIKKLFSSVPSSSDLGTEQARMIRGVVGFSETVAREIMTPRTDLVMININDSLDQVLKVIMDSGFSRMPVRGQRVDDILGILLSRDVVPYVVNEKDRANFEVKKVMRKCYFIPGTKPIDDLLSEFKRRKQHMAVILDEHGGVDGVVSMEDIIEEIVGNIYDENDEPGSEIVIMDDGSVVIEGGLLVADVNEKFGYNIPEGEYDTLAGFLFTFLGRIPKASDQLFISKAGLVFVNGKLSDSTPSDEDEIEESIFEEGLKISLESVQGHRIESVRLSKLIKKIDQSELTSESDSNLPASQD